MMSHKIKILLVENDKDDIELILYALKKGGIDFIHTSVSDSQSLKKALRDFDPEIILSDNSLPSFDALDAFQIKEKVRPEIPFIIVSGTIGEEKAVQLIKTGITDYVLKDKLFTLPGKLNRALAESKEKIAKRTAEERLAENQKRLSEAQSLAKIGNWEMDMITGESYWCDEVHKILGLKPGEVVPSREIFLSFIHPDDRKEVEKKMNETMRIFSSLSGSARILRVDGTLRYVYMNGRFIFDEPGVPVRQIGILQDVTDTKKMEEELKIVNKELETFIYRASHDLRGPLTSIIGLTNVSKSEIKDEASKKYFSMIEDSAQKLDETLISLVRSMTMRDMVVSIEPVDPEKLIAEILSLLKYHDGFSNIKITVVNSLNKKFRSNKLILTSVFQNLIQNAIKYQNYHHSEACLKISLSEKNNGTEIIFADNGIGIDDHLHDRIFEMYFRGTSSATGTGLGLYIVKIGVEKLKGSISFKSIKGEGTTFTIFLPDPE